MMTHSRAAATLATLALSATLSHADAPDSALNPATGYIETVHDEWNGFDHDIELTIDRGWLGPLTHNVLLGPTEDVGPRVAISSAGAVTTVWTRDDATDQVLARIRSAGNWSDVFTLSEASEDSRNPEILVAGALTWVVYEIEEATLQSVAIVWIEDDPDPIGRTIVATTTSMDPLDARVHESDGHLWVTWVDDDSVGWTERIAGTWSLPEFEGLDPGGVERARDRILEIVTGP